MAARHGPGIGAEIMGAGKFGPPGWQDDPEWRGGWGDDPPVHTPTYVLTHPPRPSPAGVGGRPGGGGGGGARPAVPHADVRPDPPSAPVAGDGGWYDVPLPRLPASGCTRGRTGRSRRAGRPHRRRPRGDAGGY